MEQINNLELRDEKLFPDENVLQKVLGESYVVYCQMLKLFDQNEMTYEWRYYKDGKAWLCKVQKKKKTIIWMSAWKGYLKATIYVPEKHTEGIYELPISEKTKEAIKHSKNVGKSKPCMFEIKQQDVLNELEIIMKYKIVSK